MFMFDAPFRLKKYFSIFFELFSLFTVKKCHNIYVNALHKKRKSVIIYWAFDL